MGRRTDLGARLVRTLLVRTLLVVGLAATFSSCGEVSEARDGGRSDDLGRATATEATAKDLPDLTYLTPWPCEALFPLDDLLLRSSIGDDVIDQLRSVVVPDEFEDAWSDVLALQQAAAAAGVPPDDVTDDQLVDDGLRALDALDVYVVSKPCDAAGVPPDFGCPALEQCARDVLTDPDPLVASRSVAESLSTAGDMTLGTCSTGREAMCSVSTNDERRFFLRFGQTSDGRYFAWRVRA